MLFHFGPIPDSPDFEPDESWNSLNEPSPWLAQLIAVPIGIAAALLLLFFWIVFTPIRQFAGPLSLFGLFVALAAIVVVHELIHAAVHPNAGRSPRSILGFWPAMLVFYAHYDGEITRNRFVAILLMPLVVISLLPLLFAVVAQVDIHWMALVSAFNALLASVDIFGAGMVWFQVPANAIVRNQGWMTYWREPETAAFE
jgi:hypothetical protein